MMGGWTDRQTDRWMRSPLFTTVQNVICTMKFGLLTGGR